MISDSDLLLLAAAAAVYIFAAAFVLLRRKRAGEKPRVFREMLKFGFFLYTALLLRLTVLPSFVGGGMGYVSYSLIPFHSISEYVSFAFNQRINAGAIVQNLIGNILGFIPMGLLVPAIWPRFGRFWKTLLFGMCFSMGIELVQFLLSFLGLAYRTTDVDDVILNTSGTVLGYGLFAAARLLLHFQNASSPKANPPPEQ